jgi:hypothetical protein
MPNLYAYPSALRRGTTIAGCLLAFMTYASAYADVYKWADREGHIHYTDRPPPAEGRLLSVATSARSVNLTPSEPTPTPAPAVTVAPKTAPLPPADAAALMRLKAGVAADVAARDSAACQAAQERYRQYVGARHLYRTSENGERLYLTDTELESARVQARREIEELCGQMP